MRFLAIMSYLIIIMIEVFQNIKKKKSLKILFKTRLILSSLIIIIFLYNFYIKFMYLNHKLNSERIMIWLAEGKNYNYMANVYDFVYIVDSIILLLCSIRLLVFCKLDRNLRLSYDHIRNSLMLYIRISFIIFLIIFWFSLIFHFKFGNKLIEFNGFYSSFVRTLMFTIGK